MDDTTIAPASGEFPEAFMRDLARAIRRFSFKRAHESWVEKLIDRAELEDRLIHAREGKCRAVLCLRCAVFGGGKSAGRNHRNETCVAMPLVDCTRYAGGDKSEAAVGELRRAIYRDIERFRCERNAAQRPHYDLDYYLRNEQYVFTWRPLG